MIRRTRTQSVIVLVLASAVFATAQREVLAIKPEDPKVRAAVERAVAFLGAERINPTEHAIGELALAGLAIVKSGVKGADKDHPRVKAAVSAVKSAIADRSIAQGYPAVYNTGVAIVFLSAVDKKTHKDDIAKAVAILLPYQRESGGFVTTAMSSGDTSMTQYAILGMWEAHRAGVKVPSAAWERATNWLMATQLANGGFTYTPGVGGNAASHSIVSAGLGALYICATRASGKSEENPDGKPAKKQDGDGPEGVPSVFRPVEEPGTGPKPPPEPPISFDRDAVESALGRGDAWLEANWRIEMPSWKMYYLYGIERYNAFRDIYEDRREPEPAWYNEGATNLLSTQAANGKWSGDGHDVASTAFGVLFLVRSTRASLATIDPVAKGVMVRGQGIPSDLNAIRMQEGAIVAKPLLGPAGDLIDKIADPDDPQFARAVEGFSQIVVKADDAMLSPHLVKLRDIAKSDSPAARAAAIKALAIASGGKLDDVPTLIYALEDGDWGVRIAARDGLRFISRKFDGFGMDPQGPPEEWAAGIGKWKVWFRSLRPDADFE